MGCSSSKSADTKDGSNKPQPAEAWVDKSEAIEYVSTELNISKEAAEKIVAKVNHNEDNKVSNQELVDLWERVQTAKKELRPLFEKIDKNKNGIVSNKSAVKILKTKFPNLSEQHIENIVKRYGDADKNCKYEEMLVFYSHIKAKKDTLLEKFNEMDTDGSGALKPDELVALLQEECALEEKHARSLVDDFDNNKDGSVSKAEFLDTWSKLFG